MPCYLDFNQCVKAKEGQDLDEWQKNFKENKTKLLNLV